MGGWRALSLNLSYCTAPPQKLTVGGGQNEGDAAAARASCLPPCHGDCFSFPSKKCVVA